MSPDTAKPGGEAYKVNPAMAAIDADELEFAAQLLDHDFPKSAQGVREVAAHILRYGYGRGVVEGESAKPEKPKSGRERSMAVEPKGPRERPRVPPRRVSIEAQDDSRVRVRTTFGEVVIDTNRNEGGLIDGEPILRVRVRGSMFKSVSIEKGDLSDGHERFDAEVRFDA